MDDITYKLSFVMFVDQSFRLTHTVKFSYHIHPPLPPSRISPSLQTTEYESEYRISKSIYRDSDFATCAQRLRKCNKKSICCI